MQIQLTRSSVHAFKRIPCVRRDALCACARAQIKWADISLVHAYTGETYVRTSTRTTIGVRENARARGFFPVSRRPGGPNSWINWVTGQHAGIGEGPSNYLGCLH